MPSIEFILKRLSLTSTREELRTVAYALGEWLVARDERALSATYDRLRQLRGAASPGSTARASFDTLANLLDGYFASVENVRHLERLVREVENEPMWRAVLQALADGPLNQVQLGESVGRTKSTVSVTCDDLRRRELIEMVPNASRRENVHELTSLAKQVLAQLPVAEAPPQPTSRVEVAAASQVPGKSPRARSRAARTSAPPPPPSNTGKIATVD